MREPGQGRSVDRGMSVGDDFTLLPTTKVDFLADTARLNDWLNLRQENPYRWKTGTFRLPECSETIHRKLVVLACKKFIVAMDKQGWTLESRLAATGPYKALELEHHDDGKQEFRVRAIFKTVLKTIRFEIPKDIVKRDPDQTVSLKEAINIG